MDFVDSKNENLKNQEKTLEAIREVEEMKADSSIGKEYTNISDMIEEILEL